MGDIIGGILILGVFFGLEVVALLILVLAAIYGRQLVFVIVCGIVAAVVMAAEYCIVFICAADGYASGVGGELLPIIVGSVSIVSLCLYFPIAIMRCKRRQKSAAPDAT